MSRRQEQKAGTEGSIRRQEQKAGAEGRSRRQEQKAGAECRSRRQDKEARAGRRSRQACKRRKHPDAPSQCGVEGGARPGDIVTFSSRARIPTGEIYIAIVGLWVRSWK